MNKRIWFIIIRVMRKLTTTDRAPMNMSWMIEKRADNVSCKMIKEWKYAKIKWLYKWWWKIKHKNEKNIRIKVGE